MIHVLLLIGRLRLDFSPTIRNNRLADVLSVQSENVAKTTSAITVVGNAESNLGSNQLGTQELTTLKVPGLRI